MLGFDDDFPYDFSIFNEFVLFSTAVANIKLVNNKGTFADQIGLLHARLIALGPKLNGNIFGISACSELKMVLSERTLGPSSVRG